MTRSRSRSGISMMFLALLLATSTGCAEMPGSGEEDLLPTDSYTRNQLKNWLVLSPQRNRERERLLAKAMSEAGCPSLIVEPVGRGNYHNLICNLPGRSENVIVVAAHHDKTMRGRGVADNWSGAGFLPLLIRAMLHTQAEWGLRFVGFALEEQDLKGSRAYLAGMAENDRQHIQAMINLDTLGLRRMEVDSRSDPVLRESLAAVVQSLGLKPLNAVRIGWLAGDFEPFRDQRIPYLNLHSLRPMDYKLVHSPRDSLRVINEDVYVESYQIVVTLLLRLVGESGVTRE